MRNRFTYLIVFISAIGSAQQNNVPNDTLFKKTKHIVLEEIEIKTQKDNSFGITRLNNIEGTTIYAGKKSEAVYVQDMNANLAANNSRQIFSKVAGINIFENDGSGATIGIGGRGLNPNRISNFNTRQNGYDISADALGYPESYYTPPTEAIERIEILRGAAALQFGTQFGGMINYKFKEAPKNKKIALVSRQTVGSYGFLNSFNQIYGTQKKLAYNAFYQYKHYSGWRNHSELNSHNAFLNLSYQFNENLSLKVDYTHLNYLSQQAGGLTDKQFTENPYTVNRTRNWFKVNWNLFAATLNYQINNHAKLNVLFFGLSAGREALGYLGRIDRNDDTTSNRNLLSDQYKNFGAEVKYLHRYVIGEQNCHFLLGGRFYKGQTVRKQGEANHLKTADFIFLNPNNLENSSYIFPSLNLAAFCENIFQLNKKWNVTPGIRFENIDTKAQGYYRLIYKDGAGNTILDSKINEDRSNTRHFLLAGLGTQYKFNSSIEAYANFSQNYRSINFNDMRVTNPNFEVDIHLKDETGYTTDGGIRGSIKNLLYFDASLFLLNYKNRIGTILKVDSVTYQLIRYRTNVSNSRNVGMETFAEIDWMKLFNPKSKHKLSTFINTALIHAVYINKNQVAIHHKKVEYVPEMILRTGITYAFKQFSFTTQFSHTGQQFSDATNAITSPSAIYGLIPAYNIVDVSVSYKYKNMGVFAGVNNLSNAHYFTRRAEGYPGPGILPADPINTYLCIQVGF